MRIACVSYRDWAFKIYDNISEDSEHDFLHVRSKEDFSVEKLKAFQPDKVLFYGWSWMVPKQVIQDFECIMLHPSPLPKYRGGSPIQNQIIDNQKESAVTLFIMTDEMDAGDIVGQETISLSGNLENIFDRMVEVGTKLTLNFLCGDFVRQEQDHSQATFCKRRKPSESEITLDELQNKSGDYLYNKIRMLQSPYPNAYVKTADGRKLFLTSARLEELP